MQRLRKESYKENSRNPEVENGTLQDDQNRRDFTINALALNLSEDKFGDLLDPFNGQKSLEERKLKATDSTAFVEDPLRILGILVNKYREILKTIAAEILDQVTDGNFIKRLPDLYKDLARI